MDTRTIERRRHRRIGLDLPIELHPLEAQGKKAARFTGRTKDVGLAGVLAVMPASFPLAAGAAVGVSVTVPPESSRQFPFSKLVGRGWIVRVMPASTEVGVAIALTSDVAALGTLPTY